MKLFRKQRGQLLIIYLTTLFAGGSTLALGMLATGKTIKEFEKSVKSHVQDDSRQKKSLELLEQWEDEGKALKKEYKEQRETLLDLVKEHDSEKSAFNSVINEILTMDQQTSKRLLDIQYEMREHITAEEWGIIFSEANS